MMHRVVSWFMIAYVNSLVRRRARRHERELSNCIVAALERQRKHGGYVVLIPSERYAPILHSLHVEEQDMPAVTGQCFDPCEYGVKGWRAIFEAPAFPGQWITQTIGKEQHNGKA